MFRFCAKSRWVAWDATSGRTRAKDCSCLRARRRASFCDTSRSSRRESNPHDAASHAAARSIEPREDGPSPSEGLCSDRSCGSETDLVVHDHSPFVCLKTSKAAEVRNLGGLHRLECLRRSPRLRLRNRRAQRAASGLTDTRCCFDGSEFSFQSLHETHLDRDSFKRSRVRRRSPWRREWSAHNGAAGVFFFTLSQATKRARHVASNAIVRSSPTLLITASEIDKQRLDE